MPGQGRQHRDHDRGTGPVYARLAKLFRVLSDAGSAAVLKQLGATETAMCALAAVENSATPQSSSAYTWGASAPGQQYGRQRSWPLVPGSYPYSACVAFPCLLQIAWRSVIDRGVMANFSNRRVRTRTHGGRGPRVTAAPMPI
jgi:hypothetical protein